MTKMLRIFVMEEFDPSLRSGEEEKSFEQIE
jgi:hypothetical protein